MLDKSPIYEIKNLNIHARPTKKKSESPDWVYISGQ